MRRFNIAVLAVFVLAAASCGRSTATEAVAARTVDVVALDRSTAPGDDFFRFANGAWLKTAQIPPDRSSSGAWSTLSDEAEQRTHDLLEAAAGGNAPPGSIERKIGDYYASYLDEAAIEASGTTPVQGFLKTIAGIRDRAALTEWVCGNIRADVDPLNFTNFYTDHLFGLWFSPGFDDPTRYAPYMLQGGLGMPDRDYYIDPSPAMEKIRGSYRAHIVATLKLAGIENADRKAEGIWALERQIARVHATRTQSVDVKNASAWTPDDFAQRAPGLDWAACFRAAGLSGVPRIFVWHPGAIAGSAALVGKAPLEAWRDYLAFHVINHHAGVLPKAFVDQRFAFYGKVLSGTPQLRERWKRAVDSTNGALGDAVGKLYVERYFAAEQKKQLEAVVASIVAAFGQRIDTLTWMNPTTKASAKAKLTTLKVGIGYPDSWRDYSALEIKRGEALMNLWRAQLFDYQYNRAKLGRQVDRSEWAMNPQIVNALNLPIQNAMNFPAAILRPPFYDPDAEPAVVYGAIGAIIGHEISHSFDDQGSQFDSAGRLANWWTPEDFAHFKAASAKVVAQYDAYRPFPDAHVNGQLTLSENIADIAGLSAAYDAYKQSRAGKELPPVEGFTEDQRFFVSFAQTFRSLTREALARQLLTTDGHSPDEYRADAVRNVDAWYTAFDVKAGQRLYLAPADRGRVW